MNLSARPRGLLVIGMSMAALAVASCGGDGNGASSEPTAAAAAAPTESSPATDALPTITSGDDEAGGRALPDACEVIDIGNWETITALDLTVPEQDTGSITDGGTICGITAEGTDFPFLFIVQVAPVDDPGSVENLISFLDVYDGMEQIDGIGDRALYWDKDTTYDGDAIADHPTLAFEDGATNVTITLMADSLGRVELEQLAKDVADRI